MGAKQIKCGDGECNRNWRVFQGQVVKNIKDDPRLEAIFEVDCERDVA